MQLLTAAGETAVFGGRPGPGRRCCSSARCRASQTPAERAGIDFWRALIEVNVGVPAEAVELLMRSAPDMARVDVERGLLHAVRGDLRRRLRGRRGDGRGRGRACHRDARGRHAGRAVPRGTSCAARERSSPSDFVAADAPLRAAVELARRGAMSPGAARLPGILLLASIAAVAVGDDAAAHRVNRRLVDFSRDTGAMTMLTQALPRLAFTQIANGQWSSANAGLEDGIKLARQSGQHQVLAQMQSDQALLAALRGDDETCRALAAESTEQALARRLLHVGHTARWALLLLELSRGQPEAAVIHARELTSQPLALRATLDRIDAAVRAGDADSARRLARRVRGVGRDAPARRGRWPPPSTAARCWARRPTPRRHFTAALELHAEARRPFDRARTELAFGEHLRRARRRVEAREHLRAALDALRRPSARRRGRERARHRAAGERADRAQARRQHARRADRSGDADRAATSRKA